jgi:hypothetical protein
MSDKKEDAPKVIDLQARREERVSMPVEYLREAVDNVEAKLRDGGARVDSYAVVVVLDDGKVYRDWGWGEDKGGMLYTALERMKMTIMEQLFGD